MLYTVNKIQHPQELLNLNIISKTLLRNCYQFICDGYFSHPKFWRLQIARQKSCQCAWICFVVLAKKFIILELIKEMLAKSNISIWKQSANPNSNVSTSIKPIRLYFRKVPRNQEPKKAKER